MTPHNLAHRITATTVVVVVVVVAVVVAVAVAGLSMILYPQYNFFLYISFFPPLSISFISDIFSHRSGHTHLPIVAVRGKNMLGVAVGLRELGMGWGKW